MNARRKLIAALSEDSLGGIATLADVEQAEQLVNAHAAEVLAEAVKPDDAATIYAVRDCICEEPLHPAWCPASVPSDERITSIRDGVGGPLTPRELSWLRGAAARHELHIIGARGLHWPLTDDLPGAVLLLSQYLAAAVAVIERAGLAEEKATAAAATATPELTERQTRLLDAIRTHGGEWTTRRAQHLFALTDPGVVQRGTARRDLATLHRAGHLRLVDDPDNRHYALNTRKGGA
jgi:hypothetical protein